MYLGNPPTPGWHVAAREMRAQGATLKQICGAVHRSLAAVSRALSANPAPRKRYPEKSHRVRRKADRAEVKVRDAAAREAYRTGRPVAEVYAAYGVPYVDRSAAWDVKRRSTT